MPIGRLSSSSATNHGAPLRNVFTYLLPFLALVLSGCIGAMIAGGSTAKDMAKRDSLEKAAAAGDAEAQYNLGKTFCCRVGLKMGVYDNEKATFWICKAAD